MIAKIYFNRLVSGTITFDEIPLKYLSDVRNYGLEWLKNGKITQEEYDKLFDSSK